MKKIILALSLLTLAAFFVFWYWRMPASPGAVRNIVAKPITLKLKWKHQSQFAGNYVAIEKGFYAAEGLRVTPAPFSYDDPTIDAVASGTAEFGITGADELLLARAKGLPVKAIAVIYKVNPVCAYSLKKKNILKPEDLIGKTVGLEKGVNVEFLYAAMMGKLGIDRSKIKEVTIGYDATELLNGTTDVSTGYIINEPYQVIESGQETNVILMADYGVNMYADVLFTNDNIIRTDPGLVEKFLRATLKGWQYAVENEDEAVDMTLKYSSNTKAHELHMLKSSIPLIHTGDSLLGWMEPTQWEQVNEILHEQKILDQPVRVEDAYTMDFLRRYYNK